MIEAAEFAIPCSHYGKKIEAGVVVKNKILLKEKCSSCHSLKIIYQQRLSKSRWEEIILSMHKHGMTKLTKSDYINIIKYLSKHYNQ